MLDYFEEAKRLHAKYPVVDAHMDLAGEIRLRNRNGETGIIRKYYLDNWKKAGIRLQISSIYLETEDLPGMGVLRTLDQIVCLLDEIDQHDELVFIKTKADLDAVLSSEDKIGIMLYMEGLDILFDNCKVLRAFYDLGVRGASLTWSRRNMLGQGCCRANEGTDIHGELSELGIETLHYMEEHKMFIDISHMNDDGVKQIFAETRSPLIATHSNARSVEFNYRNLTDEQIQVIKDRDGMIGINANRYITGGLQDQAGLEKLADHADYLQKAAGEDHIGIGLDLCDSYGAAAAWSEEVKFMGDCMKDQTELIHLTAILLKRGWTETQIEKFLGRNMLDYFSRFLP